MTDSTATRRMPSLSIIIPCFNCEKTLAEAVDSCYTQGIGDEEFEIVMVDDGSTDDTRGLMKKLSDGRPGISFFFHEKNLGGGAARNTAVARARANVIFCLDSDDMLPPGTLGKMLDFMREKKCDGVAKNYSKYFKGTNIHDLQRVDTFGFAGERIPFESLLEQNGVMCPLYSTFMHTKVAFAVAGSYPTNHGFDTQAFAWRFLANGLTAYTCPDTTYLHRVSFNKSYYMREYESGKVNYNWSMVFDQFLYLFNEKTRQKLLGFDLGSEHKIHEVVFAQYAPVFADGYEKLVCTDTEKKQAERIEKAGVKESTVHDRYWLASYYHRVEKWGDAVSICKSLLQSVSGFALEKVNFLMFDSMARWDGINAEEREECRKKTAAIYLDMIRNKNGSMQRLPVRISKKLGRMTTAKARRIGKAWVYIRGNVGDRLKSEHGASLIFSWIGLIVRRKMRIGFKEDCSRASKDPMDIVIKTTAKDYVTLPTSLESIRKNLCHPVNNVYIISDPNPTITAFCKKSGCIFVDERSVLGYGKEAIDYTVRGDDRSGWLFQQMVKLAGDTFTTTPYFLVVDSDTIFVNKHSFLRDGKTTFRENEDRHEPYFQVFKKIFGYEAPTRLSYTSHMMLFKSEYLKAMKNELERRHGMSWDKVYIGTAKSGEMSCISDYDTYANWVAYNHPENTISVPLHNKPLSRNSLASLENLEKKYAGKYASISFHSHIKY